MIHRLVQHTRWRIEQRLRDRRREGRRGFVPIVRAYVRAEDIELVCRNNACMAYDVDRPPGQLPRELRHRWIGPPGSRCRHCGTIGEETP